MRQPKSLKSRLILYFTATTIIISIAITIYYYISTKDSLKKNMIDNANRNISYITDNIEKKMDLAKQVSDWYFMNKTIEKVLIKKRAENESIYDPDISTAFNAMQDELMSTSIEKDVLAILVEGNNGVDLRLGADSSMISKDDIMKTGWFREGMQKNGELYWSGITENPAIIRTDIFFIPIVRPIIHTVYNNQIGWSLLGFKESLFSDAFINYKAGKKDVIYVIDRNGTCISHQNSVMVGQSFIKNSYIKKVVKKGIGYFDADTANGKKLIIFNRFSSADWIIVEELTYDALNKQNMLLLNSALFVLLISILVSSIMTVFLSSNLTNPLKKIRRQMRNISKGNFTRDLTIESNDEIGELGKGINEMAFNIKKLLELTVKEEEDKRKGELKLLQSQINPHFLYNTLNSIKWMATVQKADGIRDSVSALGRLLKNISKDTSDKVTLEEELSILEDYVFIQNIRYNGRIKLERIILGDDLLTYRIVKFTLQPIIENAIFHGIEPKKDAGRIKIFIIKKAGDLLIKIEDDGIGISEDKIKSLFLENEHDNSRGLNGIGIKNVDDRIKLTYGNKYGLHIHSLPGSYTVVKIWIPLEK